MTNCPNCGAPIRGPECEYCGTVFGEVQTTVGTDVDKIDQIVRCGFISMNDARRMMGLPLITIHHN